MLGTRRGSEMINMKISLLGFLSFAIVSCTSVTSYVTPSQNDYEISRTFNVGKDELWSQIVPAIAMEFFVINNLDKESGLINVSYDGSPEEFIDCGTISIEGPNEKFSVVFKGETPFIEYALFTPLAAIQVSRSISLQGRINLIVEEASPDKTTVTANVRYIVRRHGTNLTIGSNKVTSFDNTMSFNSNGRGVFAISGTVCRGTGALEKLLLDTAKGL